VIVSHILHRAIPSADVLCGVCRDDRASQIVEFAVSLPLLVVFVVGIFDFSGALALKQKLTNAAGEGARVAAADPANDLGNVASKTSSGVPVSVSDAFYVVDNYLLSEKINDCQLSAAAPKQTSGTLTWVSTATGCTNLSPNALTLSINRGYVTKPTIGANPTDVGNTQVMIQYPYKWRFNSVITLLVPGAKYGGVTYITATAATFNQN
jgi:Flp pilus assembly protein TadG